MTKRKVMRMVSQSVLCEVYVSFDGEEFEQEEDCIRYEQAKKDSAMVLEMVNRLQHSNLAIPLQDEYYDYTWYFVQSQRDVEILNRYLEIRSFDRCQRYNNEESDYCQVPEFSKPDWVCLSSCDVNEMGYAFSLSDYLADVKAFAEILTSSGEAISGGENSENGQ